MDVITETSLEALLQRATDFRNKNTDTAAIDAFCAIIKKETEGPLIATRLIASKIQSPQEWEALQGLSVLETCMKNCGPSFHSEIGKFRFLNEMIKLVSPKFLGSRTPSSVRNQVLKMMHSWTLNYPKEHKIKEAYDMLIKQGVIQKEEMVEQEFKVPQIPSKANPLFQDEEKVRLLQKLLHSKNPDDLQAANRLIKTMVKEDEKRVEITSKKISEVETVKNNVRLLSEMLDSYKPCQTSSEELELIKDLHQGCEKLKANICRLASDTQDNDDLLNQVLSVGDELDQVLEKYKDLIVLEKAPESVNLNENKKQNSTLLDLSSPVEDLMTLGHRQCPDILDQPISSCGLGDPLDDLVSFPIVGKQTFKPKEKTLNSLDTIFASLNSNSVENSVLFQTSENQFLMEKTKPVQKNSKLRALEELDVLGETLLRQCKFNSISRSNEKVDNGMEKKGEKVKTSFNESDHNSSNSEDDILMDITDGPISKVTTESEGLSNLEVKPLTDITVSLESIKPSLIPPINVIEERNGVSITIRVAKDTPRDDVTVYVLTIISKNSFPLSNFLFQAVVPKSCKIKLLSASGSDLPAYNPFLPPSAITQIMLIANPKKLMITLKCMISYTIENETITEMGEVENLPILS